MWNCWSCGAMNDFEEDCILCDYEWDTACVVEWCKWWNLHEFPAEQVVIKWWTERESALGYKDDCKDVEGGYTINQKS